MAAILKLLATTCDPQAPGPSFGLDSEVRPLAGALPPPLPLPPQGAAFDPYGLQSEAATAVVPQNVLPPSQYGRAPDMQRAAPSHAAAAAAPFGLQSEVASQPAPMPAPYQQQPQAFGPATALPPPAFDPYGLAEPEAAPQSVLPPPQYGLAPDLQRAPPPRAAAPAAAAAPFGLQSEVEHQPAPYQQQPQALRPAAPPPAFDPYGRPSQAEQYGLAPDVQRAAVPSRAAGPAAPYGLQSEIAPQQVPMPAPYRQQSNFGLAAEVSPSMPQAQGGYGLDRDIRVAGQAQQGPPYGQPAQQFDPYAQPAPAPGQGQYPLLSDMATQQAGLPQYTDPASVSMCGWPRGIENPM